MTPERIRELVSELENIAIDWTPDRTLSRRERDVIRDSAKALTEPVGTPPRAGWQG